MKDRGLSTDGQVVDPKVCLDCARSAEAQQELREREEFALKQIAAGRTRVAKGSEGVNPHGRASPRAGRRLVRTGIVTTWARRSPARP